MLKRRLLVFTVLITLIVAGMATMPVMAQGGLLPPTPKIPTPFDGKTHSDGLQHNSVGDWYMPAESLMERSVPLSVQSTGGPDDFGYTWDDSVALNWVNAGGGTETGLNSNTDHVGSINIGFPFKYYENTYSQLYISRFGFVAFNDNNIYNSQSDIPSVEPPNDVIAPAWGPIDNVKGYVRYLSGGTTPNRWFVVEWNNLESYFSDTDTFTFELILHENGDIVFQYGSMDVVGGYYCQSSGIEDSAGLDGLSITTSCSPPASNHAVRFYRPAVSARVQLSPLEQGTLTSAGKTLTYELSVRNTGELGTDTYNLTTASTWDITLYNASGAVLTDTNGDSIIDTGAIAQGGSMTVIAKAQVPLATNTGDSNFATVTATSSLDASKSRTAILQGAIPAPFAQVYQDNADGAMSLYLAQPNEQVVKKASSNYYYGYDTAIAETHGFVYVWSKWHHTNDTYASDIEYTLFNDSGNTTRGISKLTNNNSSTTNIYDQSPTVAVAPNGNIGVLWYRASYNGTTGLSNYNIWFAVLNSSGNIISGPINLTNNNIWGTGNDGTPRFYDSRITATGDNRFVMAWDRYSYDGISSSSIYYAVRDSSGGEIKSPVQFTNSGSYCSNPTLTMLENNRALLAYYKSGDIVYTVLDSAGNTVIAETDTGGNGYQPDAIQLSSGRILVAWQDWSDDTSFVLLDRSTYNVVAGPTLLNNLTSSKRDSLSVTADTAGHAILTWRGNGKYLYYVLVDGNGSVLTQPMIFQTAGVNTWGNPNIYTSYGGYGSTSYTINSTDNGVDAYIQSVNLVGAAPDGRASTPIDFGNNGLTMATSIVVSATLDGSLTYVSDTSGITPTQNGNTLIWNIPTNLDFLGYGSFTLYVNTPNDAIGTRYPIALEIDSTETDADETDNTTTVEVMLAHQIFLPIIMR